MSSNLAGRRVLVISGEQVGARMAGPAIRSLNLARQLAARGAAVTLAMPGPSDAPPELFDGLTLAAFGTPSLRGFRTLADAHDVVVSQPQRVDVAQGLRGSSAAIIYDLYVPSFVERIAQLGTEPAAPSLKRRLLERDRLEYATAIELGDAFICATERQRDHWFGALGQAGRLDLELLERDPRADALCGIVPFGLEDEPPAPLTPDAPGALRGTLVPEDAVVLLWTGGLWNWFDPVCVVEALAQARVREPRLHLVVMGMRHPEVHWQEQDASRQLRARAEELGLLEQGAVVLCEQWVPYAERDRFLLDADIAVSAHRDTLETRLSFRTRFLDQLWAKLPTLTTDGGELTDAMVARGAARTVAEGDIDAWSDALVELAASAETRERMSVASGGLAPEYAWSRTSEPLARIAASIRPNGAPRARRRPLQALRYALLLIRVRIQAKGLGSLGAALRGAARG
ncbi:MAG: glycosyltransferase family 4 protein [Gaiellales bacterium]